MIEACAEFTESFLMRTGDSVVLTTSRELLGVDGEVIMRLGPLPAEDGNAPAIQLFNERAGAADSQFVVDQDIAVVGAICRRLDGLPLAIELAAARTTTMTLPEIEAALDDRFHLLGGGRRPARQRTLQATLDWSYGLLRPYEQRVLAVLSVFVDGFDVEGVTHVAGVNRAAALAVLDALTSKSWVVRLDSGEIARFGLLESVKAYGEDRLTERGETFEARDRHVEHFHRLATARGHTGASELRLGVALAGERRNLTAAFEWATTTGRWSQAAELITGAYAAYIRSGAALEARQLIERAAAATMEVGRERVDELHLAVCMTAAWMNDWAAYSAAAEELTTSTRPIMRACGHTALSVRTPFADSLTDLAQVDRGRAEVTSAMNISFDPLWDLYVGMPRWVEGRIAANRGDFRGGLEGCLDFLDQCRTTDFYPTITPRAAKLAATCQILLGDPVSAIDTLAWLESLAAHADLRRIPGFTTDDIRSLALLAQGRLAEAVSVICATAIEGLSDRMPGQVCDAVVLLAALTDAEGDGRRSLELLRQMGAGLEPGIRIFSTHLAHRFGVGSEHVELQQRALDYEVDSPEGYNGTLMASQAVRGELARRGWD